MIVHFIIRPQDPPPGWVNVQDQITIADLARAAELAKGNIDLSHMPKFTTPTMAATLLLGLN